MDVNIHIKSISLQLIYLPVRYLPSQHQYNGVHNVIRGNNTSAEGVEQDQAVWQHIWNFFNQTQFGLATTNFAARHLILKALITTVRRGYCKKSCNQSEERTILGRTREDLIQDLKVDETSNFNSVSGMKIKAL